jgi:SAM-dependent methyltransferase
MGHWQVRPPDVAASVPGWHTKLKGRLKFLLPVAVSLLRAVGRPKLVAESSRAYDALALEFATEAAKLAPSGNGIWRDWLPTAYSFRLELGRTHSTRSPFHGRFSSYQSRTKMTFSKADYPPNLIIDRMVAALDLKDIQASRIEIGVVDFRGSDYASWLQNFLPRQPFRFDDTRIKKLLELFTSFSLLQIQPSDVVMDAAGGAIGYVSALNCAGRYLQDISISQKVRTMVGPGVTCIESNAANIPLPDASIDKICCHHSFEHFQMESDMAFLKEVQRMLRPGGRACIVPIFIANHYVEVTDDFRFDLKSDPRSKYVIDPTASIPGGKLCGSFARIYDLRAFIERVVDSIDFSRFKASLLEIRLDDQLTPDMSLACHKRVTAVNFPYRALTIERLG